MGIRVYWGVQSFGDFRLHREGRGSKSQFLGISVFVDFLSFRIRATGHYLLFWAGYIYKG